MADISPHYNVTPSEKRSEPTPEEQQLSELQATLCLKYPLDDAQKQIRVLEIEAEGSGGRDAIIATLKIIAPGDSAVHFNALSYVWGEAIAAEPIVCSGVRLHVRQNCYSALWHLRQELGSFTIWVDALCINQDDKYPEKQQQIQMMTEIYAAASLVYIWLGPGSTKTTRVMRHFQASSLEECLSISVGGVRHESTFRGIGRLIVSHTWWAKFATTYNPEETDLIFLLDSPWLRRMWTYQEMLFATRPVVVCGRDHVDWRTLEDALLYLSIRRDARLRDLTATWLGLGTAREKVELGDQVWPLQKRRDFIRRVARAHALFWVVFFCNLVPGSLLMLMVAIRFAVAQSFADFFNGTTIGLLATIVGCGFLLSLAVWLPPVFHSMRSRNAVTSAGNIVQGIYDREASNPLDKAYGVWNVLRKLGAKHLPTVDYKSKPRSEIYWELASALVEHTSDLDILRLAALSPLPEQHQLFCQQERSLIKPKWATWVPDWAHTTVTELPIQRHRLAIDSSGCCVISEDQANTLVKDETRLRTAELIQDCTVLIVTARELGVIKACISFRQLQQALSKSTLTDYALNLRAAIKFIQILQQLDGDVYQTLRLLDRKRTLTISELRSWLTVLCSENPNKSEHALTRIINGESNRTWPSSFLSTHNKACALLARANYAVCIVNFFDKPTMDFTVICKGRVQPDDCVLRVKGVLQPLVARRLEPRKQEVVLISTLVMNTRDLRHVGSAGLRPLERFDIH